MIANKNSKPVIFLVSLILSIFLSAPIFGWLTSSQGQTEGQLEGQLFFIVLIAFAIYAMVTSITYSILSKLFSMNIPGKTLIFKFVYIILISLAVMGVTILLFSIVYHVLF